MKILAVSGSPRIEKRSSTLKLVKAVAENTGCEYDLISLAGKKFTGCIGCGRMIMVYLVSWGQGNAVGLISQVKI